jgi:hypothetical protein
MQLSQVKDEKICDAAASHSSWPRIFGDSIPAQSTVGIFGGVAGCANPKVNLNPELRPGVMLLVLLLSVLSCWPVEDLEAGTRRYRCTWRDDPATTMVIGFEHYSGAAVRVVYDTEDHGRSWRNYQWSASPARTVNHAGMRNVFVRLKGLRPATTYNFLVVDSEGVSKQMKFETPHATPDSPLSIIAGGDSRNNRLTAQAANRLVSKLRPHFVMFGGDMTNGDTDMEWQQWFDDWQLTMSEDGRLTPIVPARGNHERANASIYNLFDVPNPDVYYGLNFAGGLLRTYTLNTLFAPGGDQLAWLSQDLSRTKAMWKIAQYHHAMRPHTLTKPERDELITLWATQFTRYGMDLVIESDAHTVKQTYPIRPSREPGSSQGFIRDDRRGTVYIGEGCWGAPLRANDDDKEWTRASGRFNQFKWIWIGLRQIQVRTVRIDRSAATFGEVDPVARFRSPPGIYYWDADNTGDVLRIPRRPDDALAFSPASNPPGGPGGNTVIQGSKAPAVVRRDAAGRVRVGFQLPETDTPIIMVVDDNMRLLFKQELTVRGPGPYSEIIQLPVMPPGQRLELIVKGGGKVLGKYQIE